MLTRHSVNLRAGGVGGTLGLGLAVMLLGSVAIAGVAQPSYSLQDLGTLPGFSSSSASAINNNGQVVGSSGPTQSSDAFLYSNGTLQDIGQLGGGAVANGINNLGQVVGFSPAAGQPFLYSGGTLQYLSGLQSAMAINDLGQIAGSYLPNSTAPYLAAAIYTNGVITNLNAPSPTYNIANAINASGQAAGTSVYGPPSYAFVYSNGTSQTISIPVGYRAEATGINNVGQVVGTSTFGYSNGVFDVDAFLYSDGVLQNLGNLGANGSSGYGINDAGEVVGQSAVADEEHGFLYVNGTMYDLNDLTAGDPGYLITSAVAINDDGQIAADAITPSGQEHAVLLSPTAIPLPNAIWSALSALPMLCLAMRLRRQRQ